MHADHGRYLLDYFGDVDVRTIGYPALRAYYNDERKRGRAKETIRKRLSTLKMAMREACARGVLGRLPEWPVIKGEVRVKDRFWTLVQWEAAHLACDDEELRTWIDNGWWLGMHSSDLDRFRWEDVDLVKGTWLRRNTKNAAVTKPVPLPLPKRLLALLRTRHRAVQPHPRDLIAGRPIGHPNRAMRELCERAGVPVISPIGLRHSCETFLEESGTSELFQMTWLGLASPAMLKRRYRHVTAPTVAAGAAAINRRSSR